MIKTEPDFKVYEYPIGGKMVVGKAILDESFMTMINGGDDEARRQVKSKLIHQMAQYMLENNLVEFTQAKMINPGTYTEETAIRVRAFITPNDQVKILRSARKLDE